MSERTTERLMLAALDRRMTHGRHLHSSSCIHNLPSVEQVERRGKTVEWWEQAIGHLPQQITPDDWEIEPLAPAPSAETP